MNTSTTQEEFCTQQHAQALAEMGFPQDESDHCWCKGEKGTWELLPISAIEDAIECFAAPRLSEAASFQHALS